jgi:hypothetical protein
MLPSVRFLWSSDCILFQTLFYCTGTYIAISEIDCAYLSAIVNFIVKGKNVPKPIKNWPQCGVSSKILALLKKHGYEKPTPIQAQVSLQSFVNFLGA